jgi:mRNA-degrading endonuclease YafQ of YafQ-DinJ toxin-antitoxin module
MKFRATEPFWKAYAQLPAQAKEKARQAFLLFQEGASSPPFHPSLRIRKMQGHPGIWEGHVTLEIVFTFHVEQDADTGETIFVFRNIGSHEIYRRP